MNFEKIEEAFGLLLENIQTIQNQLGTNFYDALIEQNAAYLGEAEDELIGKNNQRLRELNLTAEEWRRTFQFLFIKANQTEPMQHNHHFTPDSIGFLLTFLLDELVAGQTASVLEIGSGTGNLAQTILHHSQKQLDYLGVEVDDLLIDLSASMAEVMDSAMNEAMHAIQMVKEGKPEVELSPQNSFIRRLQHLLAERYQVNSKSAGKEPARRVKIGNL